MSSKRASSFGYSSSSGKKFDVFLSFQSEDTGKNFADHLCAAFDRERFKVFKSDKEHERGTPISLQLVKAIEESRISVIVFSKSYSSSNRCLDELVKIVDSMKTRAQRVIIPIFYDVEPCVVRKQTGVFKKAFTEHEEIFKENIEKVNIWRNTLKEVADISGFHLKDRYETEFIEDIVKEISSKIRGSSSSSSSRLMMNVEKLLTEVSSCLEKLRMQAEIPRERERVQLPQLSLLCFFFGQCQPFYRRVWANTFCHHVSLKGVAVVEL